MSREVYRLDTANISYDKVAGEDATFDFLASPDDVRVLRKPRAVVQGSQSAYKVLKFMRQPGPPVNGMHPYRMTLERLQ